MGSAVQWRGSQLVGYNSDWENSTLNNHPTPGVEKVLKTEYDIMTLWHNVLWLYDISMTSYANIWFSDLTIGHGRDKGRIRIIWSKYSVSLAICLGGGCYLYRHIWDMRYDNQWHNCITSLDNNIWSNMYCMMRVTIGVSQTGSNNNSFLIIEI